MSTLSIPTGFRTTESLDVAVAAANARQGATAADLRLEFHKRGLHTEDLKDEYPLVRDVPIQIVRERVEFARAAEARKEAEAKAPTTSKLVEAVKAAVAAKPAPSPAPAPTKVAAPAVRPTRPAAPSVRPREPQPQEEHVKCCSPGCQRHDLPRRMRVKPLKLIEAELGRLPTEAELIARAYCQPCYPSTMRVSYALSDTLPLLRRKLREEGRPRQSDGFGTMAAALSGVKLTR